MTQNELKARYNELYDKMRMSKDVADMKLFGAGFTKLFDKVVATNPDLARMTVEFLSAIEYHNFVTSVEASETASHFVNNDTMLTGNTEPTKGAHWNMDPAKSFLASKDIPTEEKPYYNWAALWLVMNMIYSDFANTLVDVLGTKDAEKIAVTCYKLAVAKLKDLDRPHFIREYFELDD
jgi:hypothetical protein